MNIQELCLGNKVWCDQIDCGIYTITNLSNLEKVGIDRNNEVVFLNQLHTIPVTAEVLKEWMNFKESKYSGFLSPLPIGSHFADQMRLHFEEHRCIFSMNEFSKITIRGVHHLQNLYRVIYERTLLIHAPKTWRPKP